MEWRRPLNRRAARVSRAAGLVLGGLSLVVVALVVLLPLLGRALVGGLGLLVATCVWMATSIGAGVSVWDVLGTIAGAAAGGLATPTASALLAVLVIVGIGALYLLQRLLDSGEEP